MQRLSAKVALFAWVLAAVSGFAWYVYAPQARTLGSLPAAEAEEVADLFTYLVEDRCLPFIEARGRVWRGFNAAGLDYIGSRDDWEDFQTADRRIFLSVHSSDQAQSHSCSIGDEAAVWTESDQRTIVASASRLAATWAGPEPVTLDLAEDSGLAFQVITRPRGREGRFVMVAQNPVNAGGTYTYVVIGDTLFSEEAPDA